VKAKTIVSVLEPYLDQNYHVCQDNYYNSVVTAEYLLSRKVCVCGTVRSERGITVPETWRSHILEEWGNSSSVLEG
jgi:hypothetical protein